MSASWRTRWSGPWCCCSAVTFRNELPLAVTQAYEQEDDTEPSALSVPLEGATLEDVEREAILRMLDSVGDNKSEAAKRLGISRKTLHTKLKRYGQEQD